MKTIMLKLYLLAYKFYEDKEAIYFLLPNYLHTWNSVKHILAPSY